MGFAEDLEAILNETPKERQTALLRSRTGTSRTQVGSASTVRWFPRVQPPRAADRLRGGPRAQDGQQKIRIAAVPTVADLRPCRGHPKSDGVISSGGIT